MTNSPQQPAPGWYPDPAGQAYERFWDGVAWSQATRDAPVTPVGPGNRYPGEPMGTSVPQPPYGSMQLTRLGQSGYHFASFGRRVLGSIVDSLILESAVVAIVAGFWGYFGPKLVLLTDPDSLSGLGAEPALAAAGDYFTALMVISLISLALSSAYRVILLKTWGATLGQRVFGLKVVRLGAEQVEPLDWKTAVLRGAVGSVLYGLIGFFAALPVLFSENKQTLHEMLAKAVTLDTRRTL